MSRAHIAAYRRKLAEQHRVTGSLNERVLSAAFADLLERVGRSHDLVFTAQWEGRGPRGNAIAVDGALVPKILRKPFGYWEAKDSKDDVDREIAKKLASGYPDDNIIYEDTRTAVLRQDGRETARAGLDDDDALLGLLTRFFAYERPELTEFAPRRPGSGRTCRRCSRRCAWRSAKPKCARSHSRARRPTSSPTQEKRSTRASRPRTSAKC